VNAATKGDDMPARVAQLPISITGFWPLNRIATRIAREVKLWRWRRQRSQTGSPVTVPRRRSGRAFMLASRCSDPSVGA
jgi:hypothetical protein